MSKKKYHLTYCADYNGYAALFMMEPDDYGFGKNYLDLGEGVYDRKKKTLTVGNEIYTVGYDRSCKLIGTR